MLPHSAGFEFSSAATETAEFHFPNFVRALLSGGTDDEPDQLLGRTEAAERFAGGGVLCRDRVAPGSGGDAGLSVLPNCQLAGALDHRGGGDRLPFFDPLRLSH